MSPLMKNDWNHKQSFKEVLRHVLYRTGLFGFLKPLRRLRGFQMDHLSAGNRRERFEQIYERGVWRHRDCQEAASGLGSELAATHSIRSDLPALLCDLGVKRLVDLGCGDWTWMSKMDLPCDYVGVDIVTSVIEHNRATYARPGVEFRQLDAVSDPIPECDAVLCREVIFHLSFGDATSLLRNIKRSARWLIITTDSRIWFNSDIPSGDFRLLNLQRAPFRLPAPTRVLQDDGLVRGRRLGVWQTDLL